MEEMEKEMMSSYLFNYALNFGANDIIEDVYSRVTNALFHNGSEMSTFITVMSAKLTSLKSNDTNMFNCTDVKSNLFNLLNQLNIEVDNMRQRLRLLSNSMEK